jgi:hypothetical protein
MTSKKVQGAGKRRNSSSQFYVQTMSSTGSHIGKGGQQFRNIAHSSHVMGLAPPNGGAPQQQSGFVQRVATFPPQSGPQALMHMPATDDLNVLIRSGGSTPRSPANSSGIVLSIDRIFFNVEDAAGGSFDRPKACLMPHPVRDAFARRTWTTKSSVI